MKSVLKERNMIDFFCQRLIDLKCLWCCEHVQCILAYNTKFLLLACQIDSNLMEGILLIH